jgi:hypothetical protein
MYILFIDVEIRSTQFWFMTLNWTIIGWYRTMSICQPNIMHTPMLRSTQHLCSQVSIQVCLQRT